MNGGIGGFFNYQSGDPNKNRALTFKTFYDFLFYFIIVILLMQIISGTNVKLMSFIFNLGIIIDTFAILRAEEEKKKRDMENYCFICGIDRFSFKLV